MRDFTDDIRSLRARLDEAQEYLRIDDLRARQPQLETEASRPDLWDDQDLARKITGDLAAAIDDIELFEGLTGHVDDAETLAELAREENDESQESEIERELTSVATRLDEIELRS